LFRAVNVKESMLDKTLLDLVYQNQDGFSSIFKKTAKSPLEKTPVVIISGIQSNYLPQTIKMFKEGVKKFYAQEVDYKLYAKGEKLEVPSIAFSAAVPNVAHKTLGDFIGEISKDHILTKQEKLQMSIS